MNLQSILQQDIVKRRNKRKQKQIGINKMNLYETIIKRRSIRRFKDMPVPYEVLEKCVNAARLAPSAANLQPCE